MVSVTVRVVPFVRAVWLLRQGSVALVTVVCWGLCRWWRSDDEGARGRWLAPRCWVFSSPFLAEGAAGVAGGEGGGCGGVAVVFCAAWVVGTPG